MKIPSVCCETIRRVAFSSSGIFTAERVAVNPSVNSTRPLVPMFAREMAIIPSFLGNFCTSPVGIGNDLFKPEFMEHLVSESARSQTRVRAYSGPLKLEYYIPSL